MDNKARKKEVVMWLLIGIGCIALFGVIYAIDSTIVAHNQAVIMEHRVSGGVIPSNTIDRGNIYWSIVLTGTLASVGGFILSIIMFIISLISWWVNNDSTPVQQVIKTDSDALIQLTKLYKEGLLTKQEFETEKKQLLGGKNE